MMPGGLAAQVNKLAAYCIYVLRFFIIMANHETTHSRKRRRKNKRASSAYSPTLTQNDELETAKAAARKLLDHASDLRCDHEIIAVSGKEAETNINSNPIVIDTPVASGSQPVTYTPSKNHSYSSAPQNVKNESCFYVTREEVFSDTSIVDAFQAAMTEFNFYRRLQKHSTRNGIEKGEKCGEFESVKLPQSSIDQRRASALYYGQPPSHAVSKTKKPRLDSIFLPRLPVPSNPLNKQVQSIENKEMKQDLGKGNCQSTPRRASQMSGSDLDMDEYWDMMGAQSDCESVTHEDDDDNNHNHTSNDDNHNDDDDNHNDVDDDHNDDNDNDERMQEGADKENQIIEEKNREMVVQNQQSTSERNSSNGENREKSESTKGTMTNATPTPMETIESSRSNVQINGTTTRGASNSMNLTDSQKILLSNALNAQYWAGYHTAIFNQSLGINLENLPILVPQIDNNDNSNSGSGNLNNSVTSFSPVNFSSLSFSTSQSKSPSH